MYYKKFNRFFRYEDIILILEQFKNDDSIDEILNNKSFGNINFLICSSINDKYDKYIR